MGRLTKQTVLIAVVGVAAVAIPVLFTLWKGAVDNNRRQQGATADPFRIAGNFYYVGTESLSVFLVTGPEGRAARRRLSAGDHRRHHEARIQHQRTSRC